MFAYVCEFSAISVFMEGLRAEVFDFSHFCRFSFFLKNPKNQLFGTNRERLTILQNQAGFYTDEFPWTF
jgi:hypothetical protein